jgi:hypothetical protein
MDEVLVKGGQRVRAGGDGTMGDSGSPGAVHPLRVLAERRRA